MGEAELCAAPPPGPHVVDGQLDVLRSHEVGVTLHGG